MEGKTSTLKKEYFSDLWEIRESVQQVAEAISAAMGVETEIADSNLRVVAATGIYRKNIGHVEEGGNVQAGFLFGRVILTGQEYVVPNPKDDPTYDPASLTGSTQETGLICSPITLDREVLGVIALYAVNAEQREIIFGNLQAHMEFLRKMAFLLAGKVAENRAHKALEVTTGQLSITLQALRDGVITFDENFVISHCNRQAENLLGRHNLAGQSIIDLLKNTPLETMVRSQKSLTNQEVFFHGRTQKKERHVYVSLHPVTVRRRFLGGVMVLKDYKDIQDLAYSVVEQKESHSFDEIVGVSQAIRELKEKARKVAFSDSTILITGESGTGKELLARAIHNASPRKDGPFVAVNCGAIPESLLESELFGYAPFAFTGAGREGKPGKFELANKGTIFLDEIGDMPLHLQVKILRVLQDTRISRLGATKETPIDVRIIAATNRDLEEMIKEREFREDLYFRLSVIPLRIPPLRERPEDIVPLLDYYLKKYTSITRKSIEGFSPEVLQLYQNYDWPGNVRELQNAIEYGVTMENSHLIGITSVPPRITRSMIDKWAAKSMNSGAPSTKDAPRDSKSPNLLVKAFPAPASASEAEPSSKPALKNLVAAQEKSAILDAFEKAGPGRGRVQRAASILGISRASLYRKIKALNIEIPET